MDRGEALYDTRERTVTGHKFKIGQLVNYLGRDRAYGVYQVTPTTARRQGVPVSH